MSDWGDNDNGATNWEPQGGTEEVNNNFGNMKLDGGEGNEKPRENYIPADPTEDDDEIFGSGVNTGINFEKYNEVAVEVTGDDVPPPIQSFEEAGLRQIVLTNVQRSGYKKVTPIQKHAIPIVMNGRDLMGCAQTGSGKTAAFLLPIISQLLADNTEVELGQCAPYCVILSPTRELAIQIFDNTRKFARGSPLKIEILYGGTSTRHQSSKIGKGCHIMVATPGRICDFMNRGWVKFSSVRYFVLDEADRMLEQGFRENIEEMLKNPSMTPKEQRQFLMFSATFPKDVQQLATKYLDNYLFLAVGILGGACNDVKQELIQVSKKEKKRKLFDILREESAKGPLKKTIIFVSTKATADFLAANICENHFQATSIHGDRLQSQREQALKDFSVQKMPILVATDVASRGLDIKDVANVINYDMPKCIDDYVHRIGRTGRVGNLGRSISFFDENFDGGITGALVKILNQAGQEVPGFLGGGDIGDTSNAPMYGGHDAREFSETQVQNEEDW